LTPGFSVSTIVIGLPGYNVCLAARILIGCRVGVAVRVAVSLGVAEGLGVVLGVGVGGGAVVALAVTEGTWVVGGAGVAAGPGRVPGETVVAAGMAEAAVARAPSLAGVHPVIKMMSINPRQIPANSSRKVLALPIVVLITGRRVGLASSMA
jgi:hypothetical protein